MRRETTSQSAIFHEWQAYCDFDIDFNRFSTCVFNSVWLTLPSPSEALQSSLCLSDKKHVLVGFDSGE